MRAAHRLLALSASAGLHAAAVGVGLLLAGAGMPPPIFVDLTAGAGGEAVEEARPLPRPAGSPAPRKTERPPARSHVAASPSPAAALRPEPAPVTAPRPEPSAEPAPREVATAGEGAAALASQPEPAGRGGEAAAAGPGNRAEAGAPTGPAASAGPVGEAGIGSGLGAGGSLLVLATSPGGREAAPAEYAGYLSRFRQRVQESLIYPLAARRQGLAGTVELEVLMEPTGQLRRVELVSSSSHAVLDEAALETVKGLAPLPLPEGLPRRPLRIRLPLVFELR